MTLRSKVPHVVSVVALAVVARSASAVTTYTETFNANASNWLNGGSAAPAYSATGGVADSGYISYASSFTSGATGGFGAPPLQVLFRGNNAADASGDAFVGNWIADGVQSFTVAVRHNYTSTLNFYVRFDAGSGAGASLANDAAYAIAPNTLTTLTIPIQNSNPPFLSFGAGTYGSVFSNIQNLQLGLYVPASTTFTDLVADIDNVSVTVPEPAALAAVAAGGVVMLLRRQRAV